MIVECLPIHAVAEALVGGWSIRREWRRKRLWPRSRSVGTPLTWRSHSFREAKPEAQSVQVYATGWSRTELGNYRDPSAFWSLLP